LGDGIFILYLFPPVLFFEEGTNSNQLRDRRKAVKEKTWNDYQLENLCLEGKGNQ
jgi:hypothetical protein